MGRVLPIRVRLQYHILALTSLVLGLALVIAGVFSEYHATITARNLAAQIISENAQRVHERVDQLLNNTERRGHLLAKLVNPGQTPTPESTEIQRLRKALEGWGPIFQSDLNLDYWSFTTADTGEFVMVSRDPDGHVVKQINERAGDHYHRIDEVWINDKWQPTKDDTAWKLDSRNRPYFQLAQKAGQAVWTPIYVFIAAHGEPEAGITYACPVYGANHRLLGVTTADISLRGLSTYLNSMSFAEGAEGFIIDSGPKAELIAHRDYGHLMRLVNGVPQLTPLTEFSHPTPLAVYRAWKSTRHEMSDSGQAFFADDGRKRWIASAISIHRANIDWTIFTQAPEDEFLIGIRKSRNGIFWSGIGLLLAGGLAGTALAARVAKPLGHLTREAQKLRTMAVEPKPRLQTSISEVDDLSDAVEDMKTDLRSFSRLVPGEYVRYLVENETEARLGGERRNMSVMFADMQGFSSIAEHLEPEELVPILTQFFEIATEAILQSGGTIDKFNGDDVMAFWGAPEVVPNPAESACQAMVLCQKGLRQWNARQEMQLHARYGISSGPMIVGNLGTPSRMNYTVIGDRVNLAARLQGQAKHYGVEALIDEETILLAGSRFASRPVDKVAVVGREQGVVVHELVGLAADLSPEMSEFVELSWLAFATYLAQDFAKSADFYSQVLAVRPNDGPAKLMRNRCLSYAITAPPEGWDGTHHARNK